MKNQQPNAEHNKLQIDKLPLIKQNLKGLENASVDFERYQLSLEAVKQNALAYRFVSKDLKKDATICLEAIKQNNEQHRKKANQELLLAIKNGQSEKAIALIKTMDPEAINQLKDNDGSSVLHIAIDIGDNLVIEELLSKPGINVNIQNSNKWTPLHYASEKRNIITLQKLLNHPEIDVNAMDIDRNTPLHISIYNVRKDEVLELLKHPKIDVNILDRFGRSALHHAVLSDYEIMVELLKHPKIDIDIFEVNPLVHRIQLAERENNLELAKKLLDEYDDIQAGHDTVCFLGDDFGTGFNPANHRSVSYDKTPLCFALTSMSPNINIIEILIKNGADFERVEQRDLPNRAIPLVKMLDLVKNIVNNENNDKSFDISHLKYKDLFPLIFEHYLKKHGVSIDYNSLELNIKQANLPSDIKSTTLTSLENFISNIMELEASLMSYSGEKALPGDLTLFIILKMPEIWDELNLSPEQKKFYLELYKDFEVPLSKFFENPKSLTAIEFKELAELLKNGAGIYIKNISPDNITLALNKLVENDKDTYKKYLGTLKCMTCNANVKEGILQHLAQETVAQKELVEKDNSNIIMSNEEESNEVDNQIDSSSIKKSTNYQPKVEGEFSEMDWGNQINSGSVDVEMKESGTQTDVIE
jgi:ankyrin repeat protein